MDSRMSLESEQDWPMPQQNKDLELMHIGHVMGDDGDDAAGDEEVDRADAARRERREKRANEIRELVAPLYVEDVKSLVRGRYAWRAMANFSEASSRVLAGLAACLAFASTSFSQQTALAFTAGCVSTVSIVLGTFGTFSARESRERTAQLNAILDATDVSPVPDVIIAAEPGGGNV